MGARWSHSRTRGAFLGRGASALPPWSRSRDLFNGAPSSGKSSWPRCCNARLKNRSCTCAPDQFVAAGMLPERRTDAGPFDWWNEMRPPFFAGFHRCRGVFDLARAARYFIARVVWHLAGRWASGSSST
ncbi:MAG: phosphotransferase-like protein [Actinomadura sp.]